MLKKLMLISPPSTEFDLATASDLATVERSFSSLRRIKSYLRSTMSQDRLDDLAILNIERDISSRLRDTLPSLVIKFARSHGNSKIVLL